MRPWCGGGCGVSRGWAERVCRLHYRTPVGARSICWGGFNSICNGTCVSRRCFTGEEFDISCDNLIYLCNDLWGHDANRNSCILMGTMTQIGNSCSQNITLRALLYSYYLEYNCPCISLSLQKQCNISYISQKLARWIVVKLHFVLLQCKNCYIAMNLSAELNQR